MMPGGEALMIAKLIFGTVSCIILLGCVQSEGCDRSSIFAKEIDMLTTAYDDLSGGYNQFRLFNGYLRIPNRYFLINEGWGSDKKSVVLKSAEYVAIYNSYMGCSHKETTSIIGTISFGKIEECDICSEASDDNTDYWVIREFKMRDLRVRIVEIKVTAETNRKTAIIDNGEEYLFVSDDNEKLWESILASYKIL
jgi:hypothetical protein